MARVPKSTNPPSETHADFRELVLDQLASGELDWMIQELDALVDVMGQTRTKQAVVHHGGQGRGDGHRHAEGNALGPELVEPPQQRHVGLDHAFEEPIFL